MCETTLDIMPEPYHKCVFLSPFIVPIFTEGIMYFTKNFNVVTFDFYLAYFVPQGDLCMFYIAHDIDLIITGKISSNCVVLKYV